ncbi:hypothetical protein KTJ34_02845 [Acinetobacter courvalinii]|uniref:hypothetical protein n=1 Tax=Acinetobacter courvalinii TaxID=280147 RepID=UPI0021CE418B|nr:hypothetical protein [Acinetobacter courvalinii]MCU4576350.1 hypothetical protein [Acinetobacter courvalinii]
MTMILTAHLGDCILIAADKRAMKCNVETGQMYLFHDNQQKVQLWCRGGIVSSGETIFLNRFTQYFINLKEDDTEIKYINIIYVEIIRRLLEGVPIEFLKNNIIIFSMFNGKKTLLYSIPMQLFFQPDFDSETRHQTSHYLHEIKDWDVDISCFNIPPDMSILQEFQRNLKSMESFETLQEFIDYYISKLKEIFVTHTSIDPSITTSFNLYIQSCKTGDGLALHIPNHTLPSHVPVNLNYWNHK